MAHPNGHRRIAALAALTLAPIGAALAAASTDPGAARPTLSAPAPGHSAQSDLDALRNEFEKARQLGNKSRMEEILRDGGETATRFVVSTAEAAKRTPNETLYARYAAITEAWKGAFDSDFPRNYERFLQRLPDRLESKRTAARQKYDEATVEFSEKRAAGDKEGVADVADRLHALAMEFEGMGDNYFASQAYLFEGIGKSESVQGDDADLHAVADAYKKMVELREEIELKDTFYRQTKPVAEELRGRGYGAEAKAAGEAADAPAGGAKEIGSPIVVAPTFEEVDALEDTERPSYYLDEHRQIWPSIAVKGNGSTAQIPRVDDGPTVMRASSAKVALDSDGDGEGDQDWPTRGKFEAFTMELGSGATKRPWRLMTEIGRQQDFYQGQQMNLLATDNNFQVYYIPAGAMKAEIAGEEVLIYDDNFDGVYGSMPTLWQYPELAPGSPQPDVDSIRIGGAKRAVPFSEIVDMGRGAGWFRLTVEDKGNKITAQQLELKTGEVRVKAKGLDPDFLILKGTTDGLENAYFDVAGGRSVDVPVGTYELYYGMVSKGRGLQRMKAVILPGPESPKYVVEEGERVDIEVGKPYKFLFQYDVTEDEVTVKGDTIQVLGAGGEVYDRFYLCVPYVDISLREEGARRGGAAEGMKPVVDNQGIADHGWSRMWKPLDGKLPNRFDAVEVQMTERKNDLFGKIESDWL